MHIPKSTDLWKLFDITSRPPHALLHNQFSPQASSKSHRGAWRPCQVPGAGGLWEVGPAQGVLGRLGWWAAPLATNWLFRTFMVIPGDCCWPDKVLWMPRRTLSSSFPRFWRPTTWQQDHTALLAYPENALWMFSIQSKN